MMPIVVLPAKPLLLHLRVVQRQEQQG